VDDRVVGRTVFVLGSLERYCNSSTYGHGCGYRNVTLTYSFSAKIKLTSICANTDLEINIISVCSYWECGFPTIQQHQIAFNLTLSHHFLYKKHEKSWKLSISHYKNWQLWCEVIIFNKTAAAKLFRHYDRELENETNSTQRNRNQCNIGLHICKDFSSVLEWHKHTHFI